MRNGHGGWVVLGLLLAAGGDLEAQARRVLTETRKMKSALARIKPDALKADAALAECAPRRHQGRDAVDWTCKVGALRLAAAAEKVDPELPVEKNKSLQRRAELVGLALDAADALGFYRPTSTPSPDLPRWKLSAQLEACQAAQDFYSEVLDIPEAKPAAKILETGYLDKSVPQLGKPLKRVTCDCFERALAIGRSGFLSERDAGMARAQKQIFALGCNLNTTGRERSLSGLKREQSDVNLSAHGGSARPAEADQEEAQRVADRRKKELDPCVDPRARGASAAEKLARCACPLMERWRFPRRELETPLSVQVLVAPKLAPVALEINNKGMVDKCAAVAPQ